MFAQLFLWVLRLLSIPAGVFVGFCAFKAAGFESLPDTPLELRPWVSGWHLTADQQRIIAINKWRNGSPEKAHAWLLNAIENDPTNGRVIATLVSFYVAHPSLSSLTQTQLDLLADQAEEMWPAHTQVQQMLATYWAGRKRVDKLYHHWHVQMTRDSKQRRILFPTVMGQLQNGNAWKYLLPYIKNPPKWWNSFTQYISRKADLAIVLALLGKRVDSPEPLSPSERKSYVKRLIKEKQWQKAHELWAEGYPKIFQSDNLIFDGSFEYIKPDSLFGWAQLGNKNLLIKRAPTYGMSGRQALNIQINSYNSINFKHLRQKTLLQSGQYNLSYRYRIDQLQTTEGLQLRIYCLESKELLGEGATLAKQMPWEHEQISFTVPEECTVIEIRLEAASPYQHDHFFRGSLWLDDFILKKFNDVVL